MNNVNNFDDMILGVDEIEPDNAEMEDVIGDLYYEGDDLENDDIPDMYQEDDMDMAVDDEVFDEYMEDM